MKNIDISLVLATVGRTEELKRGLEALSKQTAKSFEVILVDQNSDDRLAPLVQHAIDVGVRIKHVRMSEPNLSAARNLGLGLSEGEFVGFPDDDCWYESDVVAQLVDALRISPEVDVFVSNWVEQTSGMNISLDGGDLELSAWRRFRGGPASSISLFLRKEVLEEVGGFDSRLGVGQWFGAGEETDLILRVLEAERIIRRLPNARIHHAFTQSPTGADARVLAGLRSRSRGTGALYAKHRLNPFVVARGILTPVLQPILSGKGRVQVVRGLQCSLGRLEGCLKWG